MKVLHSICQQIWKTQQWPQTGKGLWKRFILIPKKSNAKECSDYLTIALISHTRKVVFKILQTKLQQYVNHELPDVQAGFRKGSGTLDQIANIHWIIKKARELQRNICFIDCAKAFDCVHRNKLWKILKEMGIPDHLTCLLRNLYAGQEATELDMEHQTGSKLGKEYIKAIYCHPAYIIYMQNISLEMPGVKISRRNINNLRYADDTMLMAESKDELKGLLMKVEEIGEEVGLKFNIQKTEIMASGSFSSWQVDEGTMETVTDFIFGGSKVTANGD